MTTSFGPSTNESSSTVIENVADVCPAGMVTVAGTVILDVDFELSDTTKFVTGAVDTETEAETGPAPSFTCAGKLTVNELGGARAVMTISSTTIPSVVRPKLSN